MRADYATAMGGLLHEKAAETAKLDDESCGGALFVNLPVTWQ